MRIHVPSITELAITAAAYLVGSTDIATFAHYDEEEADFDYFDTYDYDTLDLDYLYEQGDLITDGQRVGIVQRIGDSPYFDDETWVYVTSANPDKMWGDWWMLSETTHAAEIELWLDYVAVQ